jgi:NAD(P)-dependent dehydrogenase (short-subunit alcohol dehydrogenase family)
MSRLEDKVAVISGGTSGIGLAIAQRFVKEGAHVFIFGRRRDALDAAVQLIGANVTAIQADASKLEDLDRVADAVRSAKGKVDVVVSNAALVEQVPLPEITQDHTTDLRLKITAPCDRLWTDDKQARWLAAADQPHMVPAFLLLLIRRSARATCSR